jgi:hypothetical protein
MVIMYVLFTGKMRNVGKIFVGNPDGKKPFGITGHRLEINKKLYYQ